LVSTPREYVTKYALYGRTEHSQWIFIGNYIGNSDPYIEKINNLTNDIRDSVKFRYIKIVPLAYHGEKSMRFMLYGDIADHPETIEIEEKNKNQLHFNVSSERQFQTRSWFSLSKLFTLFR